VKKLGCEAYGFADVHAGEFYGDDVGVRGEGGEIV
jgi:hypothetical protein